MNFLKRMCVGRVIRKYSFCTKLRKELGVSRLRQAKSTSKTAETAERIVRSVKHFLEEDRNSIMAPGKRDTITRFKQKKQKRYITDSLKNLHLKYVKEANMNISYSLFCRMRPFWIVQPKLSDRDTCMCIIHENAKLKVQKLKQLGVLEDSNLDEIAKQLCCAKSEVGKSCMFRECKGCRDKKLIVNKKSEQETFYWEWQQVKEQREKKNGGKLAQYVVKMVTKVKLKCTIIQLISRLEESMNRRVCRHIYCMRHQFEILRQKKLELTEQETMIHVDFSENFTCKFAKQVQSAHFGSNNIQITLHTGVLYLHDGNFFPFCTISSSARHDPAAIWAHLSPVLDWVQTDYQAVQKIHFVSDGPTTQYKNRNHIFLLEKEMYKRELHATWNYTEAGHGKGAPDGVGGALKRTADRLIALGKDIPTADVFYQIMKKETTIRLMYIEQEIIENFETPEKVPAVEGIMKVKQVLTANPSQQNQNSLLQGQIMTRQLSCFCKQFCKCYNSRIFMMSASSGTSVVESVNLGDPVSSHGTRQQFSAGDWCLVLWEDDIYPGLIIKDEPQCQKVKVQALHPSTQNRFTWPEEEDVLFYKYEDVVGLIPKPSKVSHNLFTLDKEAVKHYGLII